MPQLKQLAKELRADTIFNVSQVRRLLCASLRGPTFIHSPPP